ncbi:MAG: hypothetical protein HY815_04675 [Candidatus Riflebacteria bacterium]|nr:hypothetical protein [Candidatus Riflebacteria bacterium]
MAPRALTIRALALVAGLMMARATLADTVVFKTGSTLEGAATVKGDVLELRVPEGVLSFSRQLIAEVRPGLTRLQELERDRARLTPKDSEGRWQLVAFCEAHGLKSQAREMAREVLALAPDHEGARQRLGFRRYQGRWVTPEDVYRELGLVQVRGEWMTPGAASRLGELERRLDRVQAQIAQLASENSQLAESFSQARQEVVDKERSSSDRIARLQEQLDSERSRSSSSGGILVGPAWWPPVTAAYYRPALPRPIPVFQPGQSVATQPFCGTSLRVNR